jgi:hypothetical protein
VDHPIRLLLPLAALALLRLTAEMPSLTSNNLERDGRRGRERTSTLVRRKPLHSGPEPGDNRFRDITTDEEKNNFHNNILVLQNLLSYFFVLKFNTTYYVMLIKTTHVRETTENHGV